MIKISRQSIFRELFYFSSLLFLALLVMEIIWPNIILAYLNLNFLFVIILIFGGLSLWDCRQNMKSRDK